MNYSSILSWLFLEEFANVSDFFYSLFEHGCSKIRFPVSCVRNLGEVYSCTPIRNDCTFVPIIIIFFACKTFRIRRASLLVLNRHDNAPGRGNLRTQLCVHFHGSAQAVAKDHQWECFWFFSFERQEWIHSVPTGVWFFLQHLHQSIPETT